MAEQYVKGHHNNRVFTILWCEKFAKRQDNKTEEHLDYKSRLLPKKQNLLYEV